MQTMEVVKMHNTLVTKILSTQVSPKKILDNYNTEIEELYNAIYNNNKLPLTVVYDFDEIMNSSEPIYEKQTFDEYIEELLQGATQSEFVNFLRYYEYHPNFKNNLYKKYQKNENIKSIKNTIINTIYHQMHLQLL
jgi:hypothetical protein